MRASRQTEENTDNLILAINDILFTHHQDNQEWREKPDEHFTAGFGSGSVLYVNRTSEDNVNVIMRESFGISQNENKLIQYYLKVNLRTNEIIVCKKEVLSDTLPVINADIWNS